MISQSGAIGAGMVDWAAQRDVGFSGIISIGDLVNWIMTAQEETIHHLRSYIAGGYPG